MSFFCVFMWRWIWVCCYYFVCCEQHRHTIDIDVFRYTFEWICWWLHQTIERVILMLFWSTGDVWSLCASLPYAITFQREHRITKVIWIHKGYLHGPKIVEPRFPSASHHSHTSTDSYGSSMRMGVQDQDRNTWILQITQELPGLFSHDVTLWLQWRAQGTENQTRVHVSISDTQSNSWSTFALQVRPYHSNMPIIRYAVYVFYRLVWLIRIKHQDLQRHYSEMNKPIELLGMTCYVIWTPQSICDGLATVYLRVFYQSSLGEDNFFMAPREHCG